MNPYVVVKEFEKQLCVAERLFYTSITASKLLSQAGFPRG